MELSHPPVTMQRLDNIRRKLANHAEALTPRKVGCRNAKHRAPRERAAIRIHCPCQHGCSEVADSAGVGEPERAVIATRQKRLSEGIARARRKTVAFRARISLIFVVQRDAREQYRLPECSHCVNGSEPARVPLGALAPLRGLMPPLGVAGAEACEEQPCRTNQAAHSAVELLPVRKRRVLARSSDRYRLAGRIAALQSAWESPGGAISRSVPAGA